AIEILVGKLLAGHIFQDRLRILHLLLLQIQLSLRDIDPYVGRRDLFVDLHNFASREIVLESPLGLPPEVASHFSGERCLSRKNFAGNADRTRAGTGGRAQLWPTLSYRRTHAHRLSVRADRRYRMQRSSNG